MPKKQLCTRKAFICDRIKMFQLKYTLTTALVLLLFISWQAYERGVFTFFNQEAVQRISVQEAVDLLSVEDVQILDAREKSEYEVSHLENAHLYFPETMNLLDKNKPVLIYCTVGYRSNMAAKALSELGFDEVYELKPGILGWANQEQTLIDIENRETDEVHVYDEIFSPLLTNGVAIY